MSEKIEEQCRRFDRLAHSLELNPRRLILDEVNISQHVYYMDFVLG